MAGPMEIPNVNDFIRRYESGESVNQLAKDAGVCGHTLAKCMVRHGASMRTMRESVVLAHSVIVPELDTVIARYLAGESLYKLAAECGISGPGLKGVFSRNGVRLRNYRESLPFVKRGGERTKIRSIASLAKNYLAGESLKSISDRTGFSRNVIANRFKKRGIEPRSASDAERFKWAAMTESQRSRQVHAAHVARKGLYEDEIAEMIRNAGFSVTQQSRVGPYNLDIAVDGMPFAVEVTSFSPSQFRMTKGPKRTKYLLDRGWFVVFLRRPPVRTRNYFSSEFVSKQFVALLDRARRDPSVFGRYGVLFCHPDYRPSRGYDLDGLASIEGFDSSNK